MKTSITFILPILLLAAFSESIFAQSGYQVIVNKSNSVSSMSKAEVSRMLLKKTAAWQDGIQSAPVDLPPESSVREAFTKDVLNKTVSAVKSYWQSQIFTGEKLPPEEVKSENDVLNWVESHPGGIGYVSSGTSLSGKNVKKVQVN